MNPFLCSAIAILVIVDSAFAQGGSNLLYDNGPLVNNPGGGMGGTDESVLQYTTLGMTTLGFPHQFDLGSRVADDVAISGPDGWSIDSLVFFAYQTLSGTVSTITHVSYQVWDGPPNDPGSSIIFGDLSSNRLIATTWSDIYRVLDSTSGSNTDRPIMRNTVDAGFVLSPGTYWIDWTTDGALTSGPWAPPITINGQSITGNALQYSGNWMNAVDSGTLTQQGFPFLIFGSIGAQPGWTQQISGTDNWLYAVQFIDAMTGWAAGELAILHTTNGGMDWLPQMSGTGGYINSMHFSGANDGWAVCQGGLVLNTTNGGAEWTVQVSGTSNSLNSVRFVNDHSGWTVGESGTILHTSNGGENWLTQLSGTSNNLWFVSFVDSTTGWAGGEMGTIISTTDGGMTWSAQSSGTGNWLWGGHFVDATNGWAVGHPGTIIHSTNGGTDWVAQTSGTSEYLFSVYFTDSLTGWAVGSDGTLLHTSNGGTDWVSQQSGITYNGFLSVHFVDELTGWVVGDNGIILHTTSGGMTVDAEFSPKGVEFPSHIHLDQNYPNPFNPTTTIQLSLFHSGDLTLKVFNVLAQEVATLFSGHLAAGDHAIQWDAGGHPSGVYFYRLSAENYVETKKLLLLR